MNIINSLYITGHSGFVGKNLIHFLKNEYSITTYTRGNPIIIEQDAVIHLAGKAHDFRNNDDISKYYLSNTEFTKDIFNSFLNSKASVFITLSSVKAVADVLNSELKEDFNPKPVTHYGKSKLLAEQYILKEKFPEDKRVYILRPCMIHGLGNKGNLNLLFNIVNKGFPWPLGAFENKRSFCSIDNLCFIIKELIENDKIPSGVYNVADNESISTNELIRLISQTQGKNSHIWYIPKILIYLIARLGDFLKFPLDTERLTKLTESYVVSNQKITKAINKNLPVTTKDGLIKTLNSFNTHA